MSKTHFFLATAAMLVGLGIWLILIIEPSTVTP